MQIVQSTVTLEWITPDAEAVIERAGRTAYKSKDKITQGSASLRFICDRGVTHEIVRHRLASYTQESTRYCNYGSDKHGNEIRVIQPPQLRGEACLGSNFKGEAQ